MGSSRMRLSGLLTELLSLLVVIGASPRRESWSKAATGGGGGWGLNVHQYYQMGDDEEGRLQQLPTRDFFPYIQQAEEVKLRSELSRLSITSNLEVLRERLLRGIGRRRQQVDNSQENLVRLLG